MRPYLQLIRLPNLPTAIADVLLAALAAHALPGQTGRFVLLCLASACLYSAGMVFNDVFDVAQDRRERPFRPIPSGRVSRRTAALLGTVLLGVGVGFAALAGTPSLWVALGLVAAILAYDGWLKRTWAGPLAMGTCRFLNVLLGLTVAADPERVWGWHLAFVVGLYVVGVTWFARTEARQSRTRVLAGAAAVMLASLVLAVPLPARLTPSPASPLFPYLLVGLGFLVGLPVVQAVRGPTPANVQAAVKRSLLGLVLLDATLATGLAGAAGLVVLVLVVPILLLRRWQWLYAT